MEKMPYGTELGRAAAMATPSPIAPASWRISLPVLASDKFILRELRLEDAAKGYRTFRDKIDDCIKVVLTP